MDNYGNKGFEQEKNTNTGVTEPNTGWDQNTTTTTSTVGGVKSSDKAAKMQEKLGDVTSQVKDKANKMMSDYGVNIDKVTTYFRDKDSAEMMDDLQQVVRKHPGKSVIAGLFLGLMVGRILR